MACRSRFASSMAGPQGKSNDHGGNWVWIAKDGLEWWPGREGKVQDQHGRWWGVYLRGAREDSNKLFWHFQATGQKDWWPTRATAAPSTLRSAIAPPPSASGAARSQFVGMTPPKALQTPSVESKRPFNALNVDSRTSAAACVPMAGKGDGSQWRPLGPRTLAGVQGNGGHWRPTYSPP